MLHAVSVPHHEDSFFCLWFDPIFILSSLVLFGLGIIAISRARREAVSDSWLHSFLQQRVRGGSRRSVSIRPKVGVLVTITCVGAFGFCGNAQAVSKFPEESVVPVEYFDPVETSETIGSAISGSTGSIGETSSLEEITISGSEEISSATEEISAPISEEISIPISDEISTSVSEEASNSASEMTSTAASEETFTELQSSSNSEFGSVYSANFYGGLLVYAENLTDPYVVDEFLQGEEEIVQDEEIYREEIVADESTTVSEEVVTDGGSTLIKEVTAESKTVSQKAGGGSTLIKTVAAESAAVSQRAVAVPDGGSTLTLLTLALVSILVCRNIRCGDPRRRSFL